MLFNSWIFFTFFVVVFIVYWFLLRSINTQIFFLLVVSYIFYGAWDPRFLILILGSTLVDYFSALTIFTKTHFDLGHLNAKGSDLYARALANKIEALICARNVSR